MSNRADSIACLLKADLGVRRPRRVVGRSGRGLLERPGEAEPRKPARRGDQEANREIA